MDESSTSRSGIGEPPEEPSARPEAAGPQAGSEPDQPDDFPSDPGYSIRGPRKGRFHPSRYQYDLGSVLRLFAFFSLVFLPLTLVPLQDRLAVGMVLAVSALLAIYAFCLLTWIPDSALVTFLVSSPVLLLALGWLTVMIFRR